MSTIFIASDHAGYDLKERLKKTRPQINWVDLGPLDTARVDYPDFADRLARKVTETGARGVLICGSGQGMVMRANRYPAVRAALIWNDETAKLSREHNDANVLCLAARLTKHEDCERWLDLFLATPFAGGRHADRVAKLGRSCS